MPRLLALFSILYKRDGFCHAPEDRRPEHDRTAEQNYLHITQAEYDESSLANVVGQGWRGSWCWAGLSGEGAGRLGGACVHLVSFQVNF